MEPVMRRLVRFLHRRRASGLGRPTFSLEVVVAFAIIATLAVSLFYLAGLMSPDLALLWDR
jgi:hypothetical protein